MEFLAGRLGVYRLHAGDKFLFNPTPGFYGFISQGTTACLNEGIKFLANHIESPNSPVIEEWKGSGSPLVKLDYDWLKDKTPPGMIRYLSPNHSRIEVNITNKHNAFIMGAILAHELTHHFLDTKGIRYLDIEENERMTDLATAYIGLGKLTLNGYEPISWTRKHGSINYTYQVGYLSPSDMGIVLNKVCRFRNISSDASTQNLSPSALNHYNRANKQLDEYRLKKQLVGERVCPHCSVVAHFSFPEDDCDNGLYCSACGWEWSASLKNSFIKRSRKSNLLKKILKIN